MGKREYLCRFGVRSIDEDQRCKGIGKRKTAKFGWIKLAVSVTHDNTANHYKHANFVSLTDEQSE